MPPANQCGGISSRCIVLLEHLFLPWLASSPAFGNDIMVAPAPRPYNRLCSARLTPSTGVTSRLPCHDYGVVVVSPIAVAKSAGEAVQVIDPSSSTVPVSDIDDHLVLLMHLKSPSSKPVDVNAALA